MQESIHALRCDFLCLQDSGPSRGQPRHTFRTRIIYACAQLIDGLGHAARSATVPVSHSFPEMTVISGKWPLYYSGVRSSEAAVGHLVACSGRISVGRQTERHTDRQNDYCNPRCACALRCNYKFTKLERSFEGSAW